MPRQPERAERTIPYLRRVLPSTALPTEQHLRSGPRHRPKVRRQPAFLPVARRTSLVCARDGRCSGTSPPSNHTPEGFADSSAAASAAAAARCGRDIPTGGCRFLSTTAGDFDAGGGAFALLLERVVVVVAVVAVAAVAAAIVRMTAVARRTRRGREGVRVARGRGGFVVVVVVILDAVFFTVAISSRGRN